MKKIVLTGGGTAGHVTPNLALLPSLKAAGYEITYMGSYDGIEKKLISDFDIPYVGISTGKFRRYFDPKNFTDPFRVIKGFSEAKKFLKQYKPDVVFSKGGFVSVPVVRAAAVLGIPCVIHESDMTPGLANKLCIPVAKKVCCNFPETLKLLPENKAVLTGSPIRAELSQGNKLAGLDMCGFSANKPVIMVIGVNGAGKTTTIGKLAANLKAQGKKVIVAAADTFRAAAIDQLNVWTDRAGVEIVKHSEGSDPAAVIFDALTAARARGADVVLCDTAGRLHNKKNLMEELKKIARVISREVPDACVETLLVLDATTGQNAVNQAKLFSESAEITGIVLTKLDGTAKGGIIIPIKNELGIPVKLVGVGEKIDDLQPFVPEDYVQALFE